MPIVALFRYKKFRASEPTLDEFEDMRFRDVETVQRAVEKPAIARTGRRFRWSLFRRPNCALLLAAALPNEVLPGPERCSAIDLQGFKKGLDDEFQLMEPRRQISAANSEARKPKLRLSRRPALRRSGALPSGGEPGTEPARAGRALEGAESVPTGSSF